MNDPAFVWTGPEGDFDGPDDGYLERILGQPDSVPSPNGNVPQTGQTRLVDGATFLLDESSSIVNLWGDGHGGVLWAGGETLLLVGPQGVGKTTLMHQVMLARIGLGQRVLGLDVQRDQRPVLLFASDRATQARRSLARMVGEEQRATLGASLHVWKGPPPFDIGTKPGALADFAEQLGVGAVFIDSLKDIAADVVKDEAGSRINSAFQETLARGIDLFVLHHQRKEQGGQGKPKALADVYGSTWITAGAGSVVLLWGEPGDAIISLRHLKQPLEEHGPLNIRHDHSRGTTNVHETRTLDSIIADTGTDGVTATVAAAAIFGTGTPDQNQVEKARRKLDRLINEGTVTAEDRPRPRGGRPERIYVTKTLL